MKTTKKTMGNNRDKPDLQPEDIKMSGPLSEKDEVKLAERRAQKKSDPSVAADLKNREK